MDQLHVRPALSLIMLRFRISGAVVVVIDFGVFSFLLRVFSLLLLLLLEFLFYIKANTLGALDVDHAKSIRVARIEDSPGLDPTELPQKMPHVQGATECNLIRGEVVTLSTWVNDDWWFWVKMSIEVCHFVFCLCLEFDGMLEYPRGTN